MLCALPDVLDGAVAKASGTAGPRGAFFDSVSDRVTDALLLGGVAWHLSTTHPGRIAVLPMAVLGASMLISYERAKAESLGFDARGGLMERAERIIALGVGLLFDSVLIAVLWLMLVLTLVHGGPAVREGVAAGLGAEARSARRAAGRRGGPPAPPSARGAGASARAAGRSARPPAWTSSPLGTRQPRRVARALPHPVAASGARVLGRLAGHLATERRAQVERNLRRVDPTLSGARLRRLVDETFESYAALLRGVVPAARHQRRRPRRRLPGRRLRAPRRRDGGRATAPSWPCPTSAAGSGRGSG